MDNMSLGHLVTPENKILKTNSQKLVHSKEPSSQPKGVPGQIWDNLITNKDGDHNFRATRKENGGAQTRTRVTAPSAGDWHTTSSACK